MEKEQKIIGIDLGTTFSCVGVYQNNKVEIITNEMGGRTTPSMVYFDEKGKIYVGQMAKNNLINYPNSTIYDSKRLIGRDFKSEEVQNDMKYWPFKVIEDSETGRTYIEADLGDKGKRKFKPEQISSIILKKLKEYAEIFLNQEVKYAVITVPAYFSNNQKELTKNAGYIAGLNIIKVIQEPTAAAIAYGFDKKYNSEKKILVFDFGGGTLDVSLLEMSEGFFDVLSLGGDNHLGGNDINQILINYCIQEFENNTGLNISNNKKAISRLYEACEKVKIALSFSLETHIDIDNLFNGEDFKLTIQRIDLENLCDKLFNKCIEKIDEVIQNSDLDKEEVDEIILVGGSSKIPKLKEMIKNYFNKELNDSIEPDTAIAYGAAINGYMIKKEIPPEVKKLIVSEKIPFSLGIELSGKRFDPLIKKGSPVPYSFTRRYCTSRDYQKKIIINVYEGDSNDIEKNHKLGNFILYDIPLMKKGECQINVTFDIDRDSILNVTAVELSKRVSNEIKICRDNGTLDNNEINKLKKEIDDLWENK